MATIKNYTSSVPINRSVNYIEEKLAKNGASMIIKDFSPDGVVTGLSFIINSNGVDVPYRLPAKVDACFRALREIYPNMGSARLKEQAGRTCWKIMSDWVDIQLAMIKLGQSEMQEIFLPHMYDHKKKQTFYQLAKENGIAGFLPAPE